MTTLYIRHDPDPKEFVLKISTFISKFVNNNKAVNFHRQV